MQFNINKIKGMNKMDKRGQVGETMTWVVATLIIILIIVFYLFVVNTIAKTKVSGLDLSKNQEYDRATQESLFALLSYKENWNSVYEMINDGDYGSAKLIVENVLSKYYENGVVCDFYVYSNGEKISVEKGASGEMIILNEGEIKMRCSYG
jgi:hypothetical protein